MRDHSFTRRQAIAAGAATFATTALGLGRDVQRASAAEPLVLKLAHPNGPNHPFNKLGAQFGADIEKRSKGRFKVQVYPSGTLGSEVNIVSSLQTGVINFAFHTGGFIAAFVPAVQVIDAPFLFKDVPTAQRVLAGDVGKALVSELDAKNITHLAWGRFGWRMMETTEKIITVPADLKGLKIRIQPSPIFAAMYKALGAEPVVLDNADVYVGLSQKTVNGCDYPWGGFVDFKLYEVAKHVNKTQHVYNAGVFMASKPWLSSLAPADQQIFREAAAAMIPHWNASIVDLERDDEALVKRAGCSVNGVDFAAFHQAMTPVYAEFKQKFPDLFPKLLAAVGG
jgi:tripartite ATP-independent transporter DctP family solute receptor